MKKYVIFVLSMVLTFSLAFGMNAPTAEAAKMTKTTTWKSGCDRNAWPYKTKPRSDYNPCLVHIEKTYFSRDELSKISADLGLGSGLATLGVYGYNKVATKMALRSVGGAGAFAATAAVGVGAEVMYRNAKVLGIKGWNVDRRYSYKVQSHYHDTFPTKVNISNKYVPVK